MRHSPRPPTTARRAALAAMRRALVHRALLGDDLVGMIVRKPEAEALRFVHGQGPCGDSCADTCGAKPTIAKTSNARMQCKSVIPFPLLVGPPAGYSIQAGHRSAMAEPPDQGSEQAFKKRTLTPVFLLLSARAMHCHFKRLAKANPTRLRGWKPPAPAKKAAAAALPAPAPAQKAAPPALFTELPTRKSGMPAALRAGGAAQSATRCADRGATTTESRANAVFRVSPIAGSAGHATAGSSAGARVLLNRPDSSLRRASRPWFLPTCFNSA